MNTEPCAERLEETVNCLPDTAVCVTAFTLRRHIYSLFNRFDEAMYDVLWVYWDGIREVVYGSDDFKGASRIYPVTYNGDEPEPEQENEEMVTLTRRYCV